MHHEAINNSSQLISDNGLKWFEEGLFAAAPLSTYRDRVETNGWPGLRHSGQPWHMYVELKRSFNNGFKKLVYPLLLWDNPILPTFGRKIPLKHGAWILVLGLLLSKQKINSTQNCWSNFQNYIFAPETCANDTLTIPSVPLSVPCGLLL